MLKSVRLLLSLLAFSTVFCGASNAAPLDMATVSKTSPQNLAGIMRYASESECPGIDAGTVEQCDALKPLLQHPLSLGFQHEPHWFVFSLVNSSGSPATAYMEIAYALLDNIDVYAIDSRGAIRQTYTSGDSLPFAHRPIRHPNFVFPIDLPAGEQIAIRFRVVTQSSMQVPVLIWQPEHFASDKFAEFLLFGLLIGAMLVMALYNLIMSLSTGDKSYFFCATTLFLYAFVQSDLLGISYAVLWPNSPKWNQVSMVVFDVLAIGSVAVFAQTFLQLKHKSLFTDKVLTAGAILCLLLALSVPFVPYYYLIVATSFLVATVPFVAVLKSALLWRQGLVAAKYFLFAFLFFVLAVGVYLGSKFGYLPRNLFTEYAIHFGALVVVICLSLAIADQLNHDREQRENADRQSIDSLMKFEEIYTNSNEGLFRIDSAGHFISANPAFLEILGATSLKQVKQHFNSIEAVACNDRNSLLEKLTAKDTTLNFDILCQRVDNSHMWVTLNTRLQRDTDGKIECIEGSMIDISERKGIERRLSHLANYDQLTGLINRNAFQERLTKVLEQAKEHQSEHALLYLDLDRFKLVNDTCGHMAGDELLKQLGMLFTEQVRQNDAFARIGGDEFALLLVNCDLEKATEIANHLKSAINKFNFTWQGKKFDIGASIGILKIDQYCQDVVGLMNLADSACLKAKEQGRNRIVLHDENITGVNEKVQARNLITTIQDAIKNNDFTLFRQRIISLKEPKQSTFEILLRLDLKDEIVSPATFIPTAERYNVMPKIDQWVIKAFLTHLNSQAINLEQVYMISINLSGQTLSSPDFLIDLLSLLHTKQEVSRKICFEITESAALTNLTESSATINKIKDLGVRFAVDDFGSGYASFSYLTELPVDFVKIDGSFCIDVDSNPVNRTIVKSITDISHIMGLEVIAECVETQAVMDCLKDLGVDMVQGFHLDKPSPLLTT